jgi:lysozyme family protein
MEGGWANNPADPGGCTMRGVTLSTFRHWLNEPDATAAQLRAITNAELEAIYGGLYWNAVVGANLPWGISLSVFDMAVNAGVRTSAMQLQRLLDVSEDGSIGPETLLACVGADPNVLLTDLATAHLAYYENCKGWPVFGHGWGNRVKARLAAAQAALAKSD